MQDGMRGPVAAPEKSEVIVAEALNTLRGNMHPPEFTMRELQAQLEGMREQEALPWCAACCVLRAQSNIRTCAIIRPR